MTKVHYNTSGGSDDEGTVEDEVEVPADLEMIKRVSIVESKLLELVDTYSSQGREDSTFCALPSSPVPETIESFQEHAYPCSGTFKRLPFPPEQWPQAPIMLRPTPGSDTKIRGLRHADSSTYHHYDGFCAGCILPINTGKEKPGKSLLIDFETSLFVGTLMMRVKGAEPVGLASDYSQQSYFDGKKRKFQVVVSGRFLKPLRMSECVTGQAFDRPAGDMPARILVHAFIRLVSSLAPQLDARFGDEPRFLSPLMATAHTVLVHDHLSPPGETSLASIMLASSGKMECEVNEPSLDSSTNVMTHVGALSHYSGSSASNYASVASRRALRKRYFNGIAANAADEPRFDLNKVYTFEFYQHLLLLTDPDDIKLEVVHTTTGMSATLNGQPIKMLAARKDPHTGALTPLWSFDIWHKSLYPHAHGDLEE